MERLTKIDKYGHPYTNENVNCRNLVSEDGINYQYVGYVDNFKAFDGKPIDKLYALEEIETDLGIPLEVLFKALKDGIWYEHKYYGVQFCNFVNLLDGGYWRLSIVNPKDDFEHDLDLGLEDYGKTWWLEEPKEKVSD